MYHKPELSIVSHSLFTDKNSLKNMNTLWKNDAAIHYTNLASARGYHTQLNKERLNLIRYQKSDSHKCLTKTYSFF